MPYIWVPTYTESFDTDVVTAFGTSFDNGGYFVRSYDSAGKAMALVAAGGYNAGIRADLDTQEFSKRVEMDVINKATSSGGAAGLGLVMFGGNSGGAIPAVWLYYPVHGADKIIQSYDVPPAVNVYLYNAATAPAALSMNQEFTLAFELYPDETNPGKMVAKAFFDGALLSSVANISPTSYIEGTTRFRAGIYGRNHSFNVKEFRTFKREASAVALDVTTNIFGSPNVPTIANIYLYDKTAGTFIGKFTTDASGNFSMPYIPGREVIAFAEMPDGSYVPAGAGPITL